MSKLFDELSALKEAYDTKLANEGEAAVKELFKEFFDANPKASSVVWRQYTPYFNDGDPCYFSVHEMTLNYEEDEEETESDSWSLSKAEEPSLKKMGEALKELEGIPDDVLENVFGDHVKIVATREGFDVRECSHD